MIIFWGAPGNDGGRASAATSSAGVRPEATAAEAGTSLESAGTCAEGGCTSEMRV